MPAPWLLFTMALTLTLTDVPGGCAQPEVAQQEAAMAAKHPGLGDLLHQVERLSLLGEDLQRLRGKQGDRESESQIFQPDWLSKRQHPGKREEEAEEEVEEEEEEGGAVGPHKRQHPGRREDAPVWSVDVTQQKRQHPGRRSSWLGYTFTKRQHPGRRLVDPKTQRSWEEEEEGEEEDEGELMPEKRQHPGKRALGGPCGLQGDCGQASVLLGLLDDLSRSQGTEKRQHPGRRAAWAREPLEE
ncbi:PREDICTED: thyrotropin releasing hormone [Hipposideros armiger]|uniref:Pro-thyrotropin-releasing hormone n=1 Tax=Hipposideros armiger TaxID=186990 RepID=A0A8B7RQZ2_HIPAR|nr:PREDICTED: thyrotropin releasing hormone [Hipposideros armiger]XP_019501579.1 PREDICTED: thyrotropin releasing hormone [Hipposideros armiger]XP_019501580.1 PREDICTED: thyrotropin releasing hormone [Hipposideros armiger]XP_019501581.1 PREDICTED: thyrotropin releasing hormone [Hipposideros armiger]